MSLELIAKTQPEIILAAFETLRDLVEERDSTIKRLQATIQELDGLVAALEAEIKELKIEKPIEFDSSIASVPDFLTKLFIEP